MNGSEPVAGALATKKEQPIEKSKAVKKKEKTAEPGLLGNRVLGWLVFTQILVIAGLAFSYIQGGRSLAGLSAAIQDENSDIRRLQQQSAKIETKLESMYQFVTSKTDEDVIFLKIMVTKPDVDRKLARKIAQAVAQYSKLYAQDPDLVLSIISVESRFNPEAVSVKGAVGLMQVMPQWKKVLGISEDLSDPETSIKVGLQILGFYTQMYKDPEVALTAYNRGPGPVDMALMNGRNPGNGYAPKVMKTYKMLKSMTVGRNL